MSASGMLVRTLEIPNPIYYDPRDSANYWQWVGQSISYTWRTAELVTLSTTAFDPDPASAIGGLLYVPDLIQGDPCINASVPYVPANVTRQADLPPIPDLYLIAIAPWLSTECTQNYMAAAREDPLHAFIFFQPTKTTEPPPPADAPDWDLDDGGRWKTENRYPVYAITGLEGWALTTESSKYSGNLTSAPYAEQLQAQYDPRNYIRLWMTIVTDSPSSFPSLWVFLLIVLGILLAIIALTSFLMHILQRRRRQALRDRITRGEVDLEALGIKRLTIPQYLLDEMPLYTYGTGAPMPNLAKSGKSAGHVAVGTSDATPNDDNFPPRTGPAQPSPILARTSSAYQPTALSQPTCAICLDDFIAPTTNVPDGTTVRELPCHHIFHPECVDTFLRDSSSLCPMCKKSALPKGYCPRIITNAMVRRERLVRRIRERVVVVDDTLNQSDTSNRGATDHGDLPHNSGGGPLSLMQPRTWTFSSFSRRANRIDSSSSAQEMSAVIAPAPPTTSGSSGADLLRDPQQVEEPPTQLPRDSPRWREWAHQRAVAMLGRRAPADPDVDEVGSRIPAWRKAVGNVFPVVGR